MLHLLPLCSPFQLHLNCNHLHHQVLHSKSRNLCRCCRILSHHQGQMMNHCHRHHLQLHHHMNLSLRRQSHFHRSCYHLLVLQHRLQDSPDQVQQDQGLLLILNLQTLQHQALYHCFHQVLSQLGYHSQDHLLLLNLLEGLLCYQDLYNNK